MSPRSSISSSLLHLQVNNTFLEVTGDEDDELPRTISDPTHARKKKPMFVTTIEGIKEEGTSKFASPRHLDDSPKLERAPVIADTPEATRIKNTSTATSSPSSPAYMRLHRVSRKPEPVITPVTLSSELIPAKFHDAISSMGYLSPDKRIFEKREFEGRLSMLTEDTVRSSGEHTFAVALGGSSLSPADGIGFVFGDKLPFRRNIQLIESVFINRKGQVCIRSQDRLLSMRNNFAAPLELGRVVEVKIDLENCYAKFTVFDGASGSWLGHAAVNFSELKEKSSGFFCAVLKNTGTALTILHSDTEAV